ncbi:MAG: pentapeptide repeat-containing protein [Planctomycetota bacterium]
MQSAFVRPRVRRIDASGSLPVLLEEVVAELRARDATGLVRLAGSTGAGKTSALEHLCRVLPPDGGCVYLDEPPADEVLDLGASRLVVYSAGLDAELAVEVHRACFELCPWSRDDLLEFLLAYDPARCASVFARLGEEPSGAELGGSPELWSVALRALAADESLVGATRALRGEVESCFSRRGFGRMLRRSCLLATLGDAEALPRGLSNLADLPADSSRLVRHPFVHALLAAEELVAELREGAPDFDLVRPLPPDVCALAAPLLAAEPEARRFLEQRIEEQGRVRPAPAASLLHAADREWLRGFLARGRDAKRPLPILAGARLPEACLAGLEGGVELTVDRADLHGSDWTRAEIGRLSASSADLREAVLRLARVRALAAVGANLQGADLRGLIAPSANLSSADLSGARMSRASLRGADLAHTLLAAADLRRAELSHASLVGAIVEGARFAHANLRGARMTGLDLRSVELEGASLAGADLAGSNLESMELGGVSLTRADLEGALLTDSVCREADLQGVNLRRAGLAGIDWEGADLREANLSSASFHLGSTRSGTLTGYPSQGTRTGFYDDELTDTAFRAPEEVRKASLRGADLRGARVQGTDFYLVDLREARYDADQAEHFRRCGAILSRPE